MTPTTSIEPRIWTLAFSRSSPDWWVRALAWGKYKHVRAYAYLPATRQWLFYDVAMAGTMIRIAPDNDETVKTIIWPFVDGCDLLSIRHQGPCRWPPLFGFCVPAIKRLIGLNTGALLPSAFFRDCIAAGGQAFATGNTDLPSTGTGSGACDPASPDRQAAAGCDAA